MSSLAPDLKRSFTLASFHEQGNSVIKLLFTIYSRLGAKTFTLSFRILGPMLSKPVDLFTFKFDRIQDKFVNGMLNSVVFGSFDWMKLISNSFSDNVMGSFKFEATVTY